MFQMDMGNGGIIASATKNVSKIILKKCYNTGTIGGARNRQAGIANDISCDITIEECYNTGLIGGGWTSGGILARSPDENCNVIIKKCYNVGNVDGSSYCASGICYCESDNIIIDECYNNGNISTSASSSSDGYAAGIFTGLSSNDALLITNCYNSGEIHGQYFAGGIVSYYIGSDGIVRNCYNTNMVTGKNIGGIGGLFWFTEVQNCYNLGQIAGDGNYPAGGIIGMIGSSNSNCSLCYNFGQISGGSAAGIALGSNSGQVINRCFNVGKIIGTNSSEDGCSSGIFSGMSGDTVYTCTISDNANTGDIVGTGESITGEITAIKSESSVASSNTYLRKTKNAPANGAVAKTQAEMDEIMSVQNFVNSMNSYVTTNNADSTKTRLKTWKLENGLPVFAE